MIALLALGFAVSSGVLVASPLEDEQPVYDGAEYPRLAGNPIAPCRIPSAFRTPRLPNFGRCLLAFS
jgi:hypothetical protein